MSSSTTVAESHGIEANSLLPMQEIQPNSQPSNVVVEGDIGPSQTMADDGLNVSGNDDEFPQSFALQPIKDRLQDTLLECLSEKCISNLGHKLDFERPVGMGGNYLDLASRLYPEKSNDTLKSNLRKRNHPTTYLIKKFCKEKRQQATVFKLVEALFGMRRLDAIEDILHTFESEGKDGRKNRNGSFKAKTLLEILRKHTVKDPDAVSQLSVGTRVSSESWNTEDSVSTYAMDFDYQFPVKSNYQSRPKSFSTPQDNNKKESSDVIFVACASDEIQLCIRLVQWLRNKGFDAQCIDTEKLECTQHPHQYVTNLVLKARSVIIICSPRYRDVVSDCENGIEFDGHDLAIRTVFFTMCHEFFTSGGHSGRYIPLLKPGTSRSCVVNPLSWTSAVVFEKDNKEKREAFIRRLCKEERYILGPIGPRPKIKPKLITGNISDLRK